MKVKLRKPTALLAAAAIAASAVPMFAASASAAVTDGRLAVGDTVKFDFGAEEQTAESGYYPVTPSTEFNANIDSSTGLQFGLYGNNINDYKLNEYVDGVRMVQGQITTYQAASASGSGADSDGVGPVEVTNGENGQLNGLYPIRFSMRDENNGYYKVKVKLAGLDSSKPAAATVYSERRHPIITDEAIAAGETKTVEFTATTQNVAVKNRSTGGTDTYKDDTVNVMAVGENIAITSIEITKINHTTTIWCYDDSTGCDYSTRLPFFPYQNYGGTAQYLSKYLGEGIVLCNQGDGGINAADNVHWNAAKSSISAGDYVYVQYGHNHKNDGAKGYVGSLDKYYDHAHSVGAYTILAGPIDRHNSTQYNSSTNKWSSTLSSFSKAAKYYTELMILRGRDTASQFVTKVNSSSSNGIDASIYEWADAELAKGYDAANGRSDIAFVDLNQPTLDWLAQVCETVKTTRGDSNYSASNTNYYFQATKGASVDGTHPNDLGADATAKMFIDGALAIINKSDKSAVETAEAAVLTPLLTGARSNAVTYTASNEMIMAGNAVNSLYPEVYTSSNAAAYPTAVKNVSWNENGTIASVSILKQESTLTMSAYGVLELIVKDNGGAVKGTITSTQVDNTWTDGSTTSFSTSDDTNKLLGDTAVTYDKSAGDTFTATIWQATDNGNGLNKYIDESGNNVQYSEIYVPTELEDVLITDEDGNAGEDFDFYGVLYNGTGNLNGNNGWAVVGSASKDTALGSDNGTYYANIAATSATGSFMASKKLNSKISASGRVKFSMSLKKYENTTDPINLGIGTVTNSNWPDSGVALLRINGADVSVTDGSTTKSIGTLSDSAWTTVSGTLDFDRGTLTTKLGNSDEVTTTIPNYSTSSAEVSPAAFTDFYAQGTSNKKCGVKISALYVEKYSSDDSLESYTVTAGSVNSEYGTVSISGTDGASVTAKSGSTVTVKAVPSGAMSFVNWTDVDGNILSDKAEYTFRVMGDITLTGNFGYYGTINAVDENGAVLQEIGKVPGAPGEEYTISSLPEVIEKDGAYYQLAPLESGISYARSFTMGNADETKTVTYNKNDKIVYFAEAEDHKGNSSSAGSVQTDAEKYSEGKGLIVDKSNLNSSYDINLAEDGQYTVKVGYVNGRDRTEDVYLDDVKIGSFKGTTASTAALYEIKTVSIKAGAHTLKLTTNYNLSPYLDYVLIESEKTGSLSSYTVNAVDTSGKTIKELGSGVAFIGDEVSYIVTAYVEDENHYYYKLNDSTLKDYLKTFKIEKENEAVNIEYVKAPEVVYYREAESTAGISSDRSNGGAGHANTGSPMSLTKLPLGSYIAYAYFIGNNDSAKRNLNIRDESGKEILASFGIGNGSASNKMYSASFTLDEAKTVTVGGYTNSSGNSNQSADFDYIYITSDKPKPRELETFESKKEGSESAKAYVTEFTQNAYNTSSVTWNITNTDNTKFMKETVELPKMPAGTTVQLGLMLIGNIDEVGNVTFTID